MACHIETIVPEPLAFGTVREASSNSARIQLGLIHALISSQQLATFDTPTGTTVCGQYQDDVVRYFGCSFFNKELFAVDPTGSEPRTSQGEVSATKP